MTQFVKKNNDLPATKFKQLLAGELFTTAEGKGVFLLSQDCEALIIRSPDGSRSSAGYAAAFTRDETVRRITQVTYEVEQ